MNSSNGVSLITLVVTIVVIIILASMALFSGLNTPDQASRSAFLQELANIKVAVASARTKNFEASGDLNKGFTEVVLADAPSSFVSFEAGASKGYVVNFDLLDYNVRGTGKGDSTVSAATFGVEDIYVYDKNGTVFYVKGFADDGKIYYNANTYVYDDIK